jgi:hypothetical protein
MPMNRVFSAFLLSTILLGAPPASATVDAGFQTGALGGVDMPALSTRFALGGVVHRMWSPAPALGLGLRGAVTMTSLSYGSNDGEPVIGRISGNNSGYFKDALTVIPSLALALRWQSSDLVRAGLSAGVATVASSEMKGFSLFPQPTVGAELDVRLSQTRGLRARAGVDYLGPTLGTGLLLVHVGLLWDL